MFQVLNSSQTTTSSRVNKTTSSQRLHQITASSSTSSQSSQSQLSTTTSGSNVNPHALQRDLNEFKNSMSEINNLATRSNQLSELQKRWVILVYQTARRAFYCYSPKAFDRRSRISLTIQRRKDSWRSPTSTTTAIYSWNWCHPTSNCRIKSKMSQPTDWRRTPWSLNKSEWWIHRRLRFFPTASVAKRFEEFKSRCELWLMIEF